MRLSSAGLRIVELRSFVPEICGDIAGPPNGEANDNRDKNERYSLFHCRFYALHGSPCFGLPARPWVVMAGRAAMSLHLPPKLWASASPRRKATLSGDIRLTASKECGGRDLLSQPRTTQGWAAASDAFGFCGDKNRLFRTDKFFLTVATQPLPKLANRGAAYHQICHLDHDGFPVGA